MSSTNFFAGATAIFLISTSSFASADTITSLAPANSPGLWSDHSHSGGAAEIVDLTGVGGNLETNAPAGNGALKLTTNANGSAKSEVKITGNFGTIGDFVSNGIMSYNYNHMSGAPNANIVPALKFEVLDLTDVNGDGYATFIYEPVYSGGVGAFDTWQYHYIQGDVGNVWHTSIYGASGAVYNKTIDEWHLDHSTMSDAVITSLIFGIGSGTPDQTGYVDDIFFRNGDLEFSADFEVSVVPLPAALPLYAAGMAILGFLGWRKRKHV